MRLVSVGAPIVVALSTGLIWEVVLGYVALLLLWGAGRARIQVVIEAFDDYTAVAQPSGGETDGEATSKAKQDGAEPRKDGSTAVLLANRLGEMRDLYDFVDDPEHTATPDRPLGATVQLDDTATVLRDAVTTESTVSFGPVSLPLGAIMGLFGRFVQAPRLRGAIHGDGERLVVTAELTMDGQPYSWRVPLELEEGGIGEGESRQRKLEAVIHQELAYRVFSDLTLQREAIWPATKFWLIALRKMSDCQRRPHRRRLLLREAEDNFAKALAEDERFYLACLNLGIVKRRLAALDLMPGSQGRARAQEHVLAAQEVFERAIRLRPDRWEAYHALAEAHWGTVGAAGSLEMIEGLCDRAVECGPDDRAASARILDLKGCAQEKAADVLKARGHKPESARRAAVRTRQAACRMILAELTRAKLLQLRARERRRLGALGRQAAQALVNLGWSIWHERMARAHAARTARGRRRRERSAFRRMYATCRLAVRIADIDARAHHDLSDLAARTRRWKKAQHEASAAARVDPANPLYAAQLAFVLAARKDHGRAAEACARAERRIDFAAASDVKAQGLLIEAYRKLGDAGRAEALEKRKRLSSEIAETGQDMRELLELLERCEKERDWEAAYLRAHIGRLIRDDQQRDPAARGGEAERYFRRALGWYVHHQPDDVRIAQLHSDLSTAAAMQPGRSAEALAEAEAAVTRRPLQASYRAILATAHEAGGDLYHACSAAQHALLLDPDNPDLHYRLGELRWKLAESLADPFAHDAERTRAALEFGEALDLYEYDRRAERRTAHWWLAMSNFALSQFAKVPEQLRFVLSSIPRSDDASPEERGLEAATELWLAMTYRKLQKFAEAEQHGRRAIEAGSHLEHVRGVPPTRNLTDALDDDRWPLGLVLALSHMQVAGCHADRDGDLSTAGDHLRDADAALKRTLAAARPTSPTAVAAKDARADYWAESGRLRLAEGNPARAIEYLKRSTNLDPGEADVYLLLARAHVLAAQQLKEAEWQEHVRHARDACRRTREIGGADHPDTRAAKDLEGELQRIESTAGVEIPGPAGNGDGAGGPPVTIPTP